MNRYPFCLFRIPENGGRVLWEITNTCNYHCSYCIFSSESKKYENELSTEEIKKAIKELKEKLTNESINYEKVNYLKHNATHRCADGLSQPGLGVS